MIQTDKERLAISTAIAVLLYSGFFAATAWLDILQPAEPKDYGTLTVEVALQDPDPVEIPPPETETTPPEEVPAPPPTVERVPERVPEPAPERVPPPEPEREPPPQREPQRTPEPVPERTQQPAAEPAPAAAEAGRTSGPAPGASSDSGAAGSPGAADAAGDGAQQSTAPTTGDEVAQAAVPVREFFDAGETDSVTDPRGATESEFFRSTEPDTPTDLYGKDEVVPGKQTETARAEDEEAQTAEESEGGSDFNISQGIGELESIVDRAARSQSGSGNGGETASGTGEGEAGGNGVIVAEDFTALMRERGVSQRQDPDIRSIGLPGGLRRMNVWVEFVIRPNGVVESVTVEDTGDSTLTAKIREALKKWKFEPIQQDIQQVARLLYRIEASN